MNESRYWILDPIGHREHLRGQPVEVPPGFEGAAVISMIPDPEDWACDFCNASIAIQLEDGTPAMVPCDAGDNALCLTCAVRAGYAPGKPGSWTPEGVTCGCPPCHAIAADATLTLREVGRRLPEHGVLEGASS